jgi:hypothetical protein
VLTLSSIVTDGVNDNGNSWEDNEFEFPATDANGWTLNTVRCEQVGPTVSINVSTWPYCSSTTVHQSTPAEVAWIEIYVKEADGGPFQNPDDYWARFLAGGGFQWIRVTQTESYFANLYNTDTIGSVSCNPPVRFGDPHCPQVAVSFTW